MYTRKCGPRKEVTFTSVPVGPNYSNEELELKIVTLLIDGRVKQAKFIASTVCNASEIVQQWIKEYCED